MNASKTVTIASSAAFRHSARLCVALCATILGQALWNAASAQKQVMGIPRGTTVDFAKGESIVNAFCLEEHVHGAPDKGAPLTAAVGKVRIFLNNGDPLIVDLQDAIKNKYLRLTGTDTDSKLFIEAGEHVVRVEFTDPTALFENENDLRTVPRDQLRNEVDRALEGISPNKERQKTEQQRVWGRRFGTYETRDAGTRRVEWWHGGPRRMQVIYQRLATHSDSSLIRTPSGKYILHDAGAQEEELDHLLSKVEHDEQGIRRIAIVLTHPDFDHYKGLRKLFERQAQNGDIVIDEVIVGATHASVANVLTRAELFTPSFGKLIDDYLGKTSQYTMVSSKDDLARFRRSGSTGFSLIEVRKPDIAPKYAPRQYSLKVDEPDFSLSLLLPRGSEDIATSSDKRHAHNIITLYKHQFFSLMDLGDASPRQLEEFIVSDIWANIIPEADVINSWDRKIELQRRQLARAQDSGQTEDAKELTAEIEALTREKTTALADRKAKIVVIKEAESKEGFPPSAHYKSINEDYEALVVKWPHHAWRPEKSTRPKTYNMMKAWLRAMRPHEVFVNVETNANEEVLRRVEDIENLVKEALEDAKAAGETLDIRVRRLSDEEWHEYVGQCELHLHDPNDWRVHLSQNDLCMPCMPPTPKRDRRSWEVDRQETWWHEVWQG